MFPFRFAMRRKRGLPHMIVYLLSSSPKNGVELMDGVESITRGWWRPTPGSIYPMLKDLADQGVIKKLEDGRYELTQAGRAQVEESSRPPLRPHWPRTTDDMVTQMHSFVSYMEDVKSSQESELEPQRSSLRELGRRLLKLAGEERGKEEADDKR